MEHTKLHILDIEKNAEGSFLAYLSPADKNGTPQSGWRIAGPKAWGGSRKIARLAIGSDDLITYIKTYAPDVKNALTKDCTRHDELLEALKEVDLALRKAWKERTLPADVISDKLACKITTAIGKTEVK